MILQQRDQKTELKITHLNGLIEENQDQLIAAVEYAENKKSKCEKLREFFSFGKKDNDEDCKQTNSTEDGSDNEDSKALKKRLYVLDFDGDVKASAVDAFREEISLLCLQADPKTDRVFICLESPGGMVHGYGLAAAQIVRLKEAGFHVTVGVDKVAASGGYMMACVADEIVCAPFAIVGSVGVVAQMPNFNKLLDKLNIDFDVYTAGEFKRTVTIFGEKDEAGVKKFKQELEETHVLFKSFVAKHRPSLDIERIATGEHWYGDVALELGLVDSINTTDSYLLKALEDHNVYRVELAKKRSKLEKLGISASQAAVDKLPSALYRLNHMFKTNVTHKDS